MRIRRDVGAGAEHRRFGSATEGVSGRPCQHGLVGSDPKLLAADERLVLRTRTHAKALVRPAALLIVLAAAVGAGAALAPAAHERAGRVVVLTIGLALTLWWVLVPFLRWWTTMYTLTTHRLITRRGVLHRISKEFPLVRVTDLTVDRRLLDRLLGCGTIQVRTTAEHGAALLTDVPQVEQMQAAMTELLVGASPNWNPSG